MPKIEKRRHESARNRRKKQEQAFCENKHTGINDTTDADQVYLVKIVFLICLTKKRKYRVKKMSYIAQ